MFNWVYMARKRARIEKILQMDMSEILWRIQDNSDGYSGFC